MFETCLKVLCLVTVYLTKVHEHAMISMGLEIQLVTQITPGYRFMSVNLPKLQKCI